MKQLIAYHNDPSLKRDLLAELAEHRKLDQIVKGRYGEGSNGDFRGCAVGCSLHSLNRKRGTKHAYGSREAYESGFGIPRQLAYLEDRIFEGLLNGLHLKWPERFMRAIKPGADLSLVTAKFMLWLLVDQKDGVIRFAGKYQDIEEAIERVAGLYQKILKGTAVSDAEWSSAAAYAAAYAAADAAYAAADAAAYAAYAAAYAAYAAAYAYAYASATHYEKMADKLIELLRAA